MGQELVSVGNSMPTMTKEYCIIMRIRLRKQKPYNAVHQHR